MAYSNFCFMNSLVISTSKVSLYSSSQFMFSTTRELLKMQVPFEVTNVVESEQVQPYKVPVIF